MPTYLQKEKATPAASVYRICQEGPNLSCYIVSTPETRQICNCPQLLGCAYTDALRAAMVSALQNLPFMPSLIEKNPETSLCVLNLLRGGLNFDLRNALHLAYGVNRHATCFLSSQRHREKEHFIIKEDNYRKFNFPPKCVLFIGDVAATGGTLDNGLRLVKDYLEQHLLGIKNLVFFTIGCDRVEQILAECDKQLCQMSPDYQGTYVVYLEGRFKMVEKGSPLRLRFEDTDFVRFDCLLAPEFELSQYDDLTYPLERCTIYDAGSRAYDILAYLEDVREYWRDVKNEAAGGWSLYEALKERWPESEYSDYKTFIKAKTATWQGVDNDILHKLYQAYQRRWSEPFSSQSRSAEVLLRLCEAHLARLNAPMVAPFFVTPATPRESVMQCR
jgi:hypothetical protein